MASVHPARLSKDLVPITEFKSQVAEHLARVNESRDPLVITQRGKAAGILLSPAAYDELMSAVYVAKINAGLADIEAGRTLSHEDAMAELRARFPRTTGKAKKRKR